MAISYVDRLSTNISTTPSTSGNFTPSTAVANYITFSAGMDGSIFDILILDSTVPGWEIRTNCTYTYSTNTLSRGTLVQSSTGSAVNLTSNSVVSNILTAERIVAIQASIPPAAIDYMNYTFSGGV